jgi:hypothetical protein
MPKFCSGSSLMVIAKNSGGICMISADTAVTRFDQFFFLHGTQSAAFYRNVWHILNPPSNSFAA